MAGRPGGGVCGSPGAGPGLDHARGRQSSGRRCSALEPDQAAHVGDQVGEPEPGRGPGEADRADDQTESALLSGEDVLDRDPDSRPAGVAADQVRRHRFAARLRPLELRRQPTARQQR